MNAGLLDLYLTYQPHDVISYIDKFGDLSLSTQTDYRSRQGWQQAKGGFLYLTQLPLFRDLGLMLVRLW